MFLNKHYKKPVRLISTLPINLFVIILFTFVNTEDCGNPQTKLYDNQTPLGLPADSNTTQIECINMVTRTCCSEDYQRDFSITYTADKVDELDTWNFNVNKNITNFLDSYKDFIDFLPIHYSSITFDRKQALADLDYFRQKQTWMLSLKSKCFEYLWRHKSVMMCYACDSTYDKIQLLRNRTIEAYYNENMCQQIQEVCVDYTRHYVDLAEKAKYLYDWVRTELAYPAYSSSEQALVNDYNMFMKPFFECYHTHFCRQLCYTLIDGFGMTNFTRPTVPYWQWFTDGQTQQEQTKQAAATGSLRIQESNALETPKQEVKQGVIVDDYISLLENFPKNNLDSYENALPNDKKDNKSIQKSDCTTSERILQSNYEIYLNSLNDYISVPIYSNTYTFNTFTESSKIQNLTFTDTHSNKSLIIINILISLQLIYSIM